MHLLPKHGRDSALSWILESARDEFSAERIELWLWDSGAAVLWLAAVMSGDQAFEFDQHAESVVHPGDGLLGKIAEERVAVIDFQPTYIQSDVFPARASSGSAGTQVYFAGYPLNFRDQFIGVMACYTRVPVQRDLQTSWWVLGNAAAIALHDTLQLRHRDLTIAVLARLVADASTAKTQRGIAWLIRELAALAQRELQCEEAILVLLDHSSSEVIFHQGEKTHRRPLAGSIAEQVVASGSELHSATSANVASGNGGAVIAVPVRNSGGEIIAVLQALRNSGQRFSERDQRSARFLAASIGTALESCLTTEIAN